MVTRWYPAQASMPMRDAMSRLFEESFVRPGFGFFGSANLPLNVYERDDNLVVEALLPGIKPEDVDVAVDQGTLTITAKREGPAAEAGRQATWYAQEVWTGEIRRSLALPFEVDVDKAQANYTHGLLTLTLPKAEAVRPKRIQIGTGAPNQIEAASRTR